MKQEVSYDQLISEFISARAESDNFIWKQAAIAFFLREHMQVPANTVAGDVGYSSRYISSLVKAFNAFPEESDRAMDMSFSHHLLAAGTDDPVHWLDLACKEAWSVREMQRAINGEQPETDPLEKAQRAWNKIISILEDGDDASDYIKEQIIMVAGQFE